MPFQGRNPNPVLARFLGQLAETNSQLGAQLAQLTLDIQRVRTQRDAFRERAARIEEQQASLTSDIALGEGYQTVPADFQPLLPTIAVENQLTLYQGSRVIEIRYLGRGHTSGDLIVHLPKEHLVIAGDLVVWPIPLIGGDQSHVSDWGATLEKLRELRPDTIIPGHGPIMRDDSYVQQLIRLMTSIKQQTEAAVARGEELDQVRKSINLVELRKLFVGESKVRNTLFSVYVAGPGVESAFRR
jgi:glyoxylase-like metal-dependent hydrolase (beta-lactamase superfamily II)